MVGASSVASASHVSIASRTGCKVAQREWGRTWPDCWGYMRQVTCVVSPVMCAVPARAVVRICVLPSYRSAPHFAVCFCEGLLLGQTAATAAAHLRAQADVVRLSQAQNAPFTARSLMELWGLLGAATLKLQICANVPPPRCHRRIDHLPEARMLAHRRLSLPFASTATP